MLVSLRPAGAALELRRSSLGPEAEGTFGGDPRPVALASLPGQVHSSIAVIALPLPMPMAFWGHGARPARFRG